MKIILDLNANVAKEVILNPTTENESWREISNDNEVILVNFATSKNLTAKSMMFPHRSIHKYKYIGHLQMGKPTIK
jgi:hypothetical protein